MFIARKEEQLHPKWRKKKRNEGWFGMERAAKDPSSWIVTVSHYEQPGNTGCPF